METNHDNFRKLIESSVALTREGWMHASTSSGYQEAMELLKSKVARIELRISFDPAPSVTCELIRDEDGECIGHIFQHSARTATVN